MRLKGQGKAETKIENGTSGENTVHTIQRHRYKAMSISTYRASVQTTDYRYWREHIMAPNPSSHRIKPPPPFKMDYLNNEVLPYLGGRSHRQLPEGLASKHDVEVRVPEVFAP